MTTADEARTAKKVDLTECILMSRAIMGIKAVALCSFLTYLYMCGGWL